MLTPFAGKKTYFAACVTIAGALCGALAGTMSWQQAAALVMPALLAAALRHGMSTSTAAVLQAVVDAAARSADAAAKKAGIVLVALLGAALGLSACSGGAAKSGVEVATALSSPQAQSLLAGIGNFAPAVGQVMAKLNSGLAAAEPDKEMLCGGISWLDAGFQVAVGVGVVPAADGAMERAAMVAANDACAGSTTDVASAVQTVAKAYTETTAALQKAGVPVPDPTLAAAAASPAKS